MSLSNKRNTGHSVATATKKINYIALKVFNSIKAASDINVELLYILFISMGDDQNFFHGICK